MYRHASLSMYDSSLSFNGCKSKMDRHRVFSWRTITQQIQNKWYNCFYSLLSKCIFNNLYSSRRQHCKYSTNSMGQGDGCFVKTTFMINPIEFRIS